MARHEIDLIKIQQHINNLSALLEAKREAEKPKEDEVAQDKMAEENIEDVTAAIILNELNALAEVPVAVEFIDEASQDLHVRTLRTAFEKINQNEGKAKKFIFQESFYDQILTIQRFIAHTWPLNVEGAEEEGKTTYRDPLDHDTYFVSDGEDVVATSAGYLYQKKTLNQYFSSNKAYVFIDRVPYAQDPFGNTLTEREIKALRRQGISISSAKNGLSFINQFFYLSGARKQRVAQEKQGYSLTVPALRGAFIGSVIGALVGVSLSALLIYFAFPISVWVAASAITSSVLAGGIRGLRYHSVKDFFVDSSSALITHLMLIGLVAFIAPPLSGFLASNGWITSSLLNAVTSNFTYILAAIPVVTSALGGIVALFQRDGMSRFFGELVRIPSQIALIFSEGIFTLMANLAAGFFLHPVVLPKQVKGEKMEKEDPAAETNTEENGEALDFRPEGIEPVARNNSSADILNGLGVEADNLSDHLNGMNEYADDKVTALGKNRSLTISHSDFEAAGDDNRITGVEALMEGVGSNEPFELPEEEEQPKKASRFGWAKNKW